MTKRPHPARTARLVSTGAAASLTFGVVGALAFTDATAAPKSSAAIVIEQIVGQTPPQKIGQTDGSVATTTQTSAMITVIRRVHYLQPVATVKPFPPVVVDAVVFSPKTAVRASVQPTAASARKLPSARRAAVKRQAPTRRARRATRAS